MSDTPDQPVTSAAVHNARFGQPQQESGLPLALVIRWADEEDTFLATPEVRGDLLILELDDGRTIELDRKEIVDRAA